MGLIILLMVIVAVSSPLFLQQLQSAAILPEGGTIFVASLSLQADLAV